MTKMTREAASRIQSAACIAGNGVISAGSFAARAMSAAYRNQPLTASTNQGNLLCKVGLFAAVAVSTAVVSYCAYLSHKATQPL